MAPWATLVQNVVFSYVLLYVVIFGEPWWDKWLAWGENIYHFKYSSKFWLSGYGVRREFIDVAVQFKDGQDVPFNHSVAYVYYVFTGVIFIKGLNFSIILSCLL